MVVTVCAQEIFETIKANDFNMVKALIEKNNSLINLRDNNGGTPLQCAVVAGSFTITEFLVSAGADLNFQDNRGYTVLHYACQYNTEALAVLLIEKGAETDLPDKRGLTPLFMAARAGNLRIVKMLVERGANINPPAAGGWVTPLSWAAENGFTDVVDYLLESGAVADDKNRWLIQFSVTKGLARLFNALSDKGVKFELRNNNGGNIIHLAAEGGSVNIIEALLKNNIDINQPDRYGWTPLHYAVYNDREDAVKFLLVKGATINSMDLAGKTPLNIAVSRGNLNIADILDADNKEKNEQLFPALQGDFLGQKEPGDSPVLFAPGIVSSVEIEHASLTMSPDGSEIFWTSSYKAPVKFGQSGSFKVWSSKRTDDHWSVPQLAFFTKNQITTDDVPFISPSGKRMIFMSRRSTSPGGQDETKENYWYVDKTTEGWSQPELLNGIINDFQVRWQVSVSGSGSLCFGATRPDGKGGSDIYLSKMTGGTYSKPVNIGDSINSPAEEFAPFIAPDESYIIFGRESRTDRSFKNGLYVAFRNSEGNWSAPVYMGDEINQGGAASPYVSPDGRYLFFNSGRNGNYDIYWVSAKIIDELRSK